MKLLKWIILLCAVTLAVATFHANRIQGGLEFGLRDGSGAETAELPKRQAKVTSSSFWEIGRNSNGPGGERENPYAE